MIAQPMFADVIAGVLALLATSSALGAWLARHVTGPRACDAVAELNARTRSWWMMAAVFIGALAVGPGVTVAFFAAMSFLALREFLSLTPGDPADHAALVASFYGVLPLHYAVVALGMPGAWGLAAPLAAVIALPVLCAASGCTRDFTARAARMVFGVLLTICGLGAAPALLCLPSHGLPPSMPLLFVMLVVQTSDVAQYIVGKLVGRTALAPTISPGKTVEGLAGGGLVAVCLAAALHGLTPFPALQAAALGAVIVAAGSGGGLVLSAVKRDLGAKDWGTMIGGHGGVLDRLDGVCFAAPVFFLALRLWGL